MSFLFTRIHLALADASPAGIAAALKEVPKLTSLFDSHSASRRAEGFDHVAIDLQPFAGSGVHFIKDLNGPERDYEVARYIQQNCVKSVAKRLKPRKSLALFMDGTDPMFKLRRLRRVQSKKAEARFFRCASAPLSFAIEDRLRYYVAGENNNNFQGQEFLLSGPCTPGPVEGKISAWLLDLAERAEANKSSSSSSPPASSEATSPAAAATNSTSASTSNVNEIKRSDSIAIVGGGSELYMIALAATPFHNIQVFIMEKGELKTLDFQDVIKWHTPVTDTSPASSGLNIMQEWLQTGENELYTRARLDLVLIHLLGAGFDALELPGVGNCNLREMTEKYFIQNLPKKQFLTKDDPASGELVIDPAALENFIARVANIKLDGRNQEHVTVRDHLEILMQSMHCLCEGGIKNYGFVPQAKADPADKAASLISAQQLVHHLRSLAGKSQTVKASVDPTFAVTPAEMLFIGAQVPDWINTMAPAFTAGYRVPNGVADSVVKVNDVQKALDLTRNEVLKSAQSQKLHRALDHAPTHLFKRTAGSAGPPSGFSYYPVNLGVASAEAKTRHKLANSSDIGLSIVRKIKNPVVAFEKESRTWVDKVPADISAVNNPAYTSLQNSDKRELTIVNWNVQFNRYSGKTTPLGKPGIDWCSATRYISLSHVLSRTNADIIGMQEVEAPFWKYLSQQEWVRENYMFSCSASSGSSIDPWGSLVLINKRLPITSLGIVNVPGHPGHVSLMPSVNIKLTESGTTLCLNVCHLLAPYNQANIDSRKSQIERLIDRLSKKYVGEDVVIMGDFNDYPSNFFAGFPASMGKYRDAWVEVHGGDDGDAGWTINGRTNTYTSLLIEPEFFGRADRMYVKSNYLKAKEASLIGTRKVSVENGVDCKDYLFPSDHYGVMIKYDLLL